MIAVLVGRPLEETWGDISNEVAELMLHAGQQMKPDTSRRGIYTAIHTGVSYGGGQQVAQFLAFRQMGI